MIDYHHHIYIGYTINLEEDGWIFYKRHPITGSLIFVGYHYEIRIPNYYRGWHPTFFKQWVLDNCEDIENIGW